MGFCGVNMAVDVVNTFVVDVNNGDDVVVAVVVVVIDINECKR